MSERRKARTKFYANSHQRRTMFFQQSRTLAELLTMDKFYN